CVGERRAGRDRKTNSVLLGDAGADRIGVASRGIEVIRTLGDKRRRSNDAERQYRQKGRNRHAASANSPASARRISEAVSVQANSAAKEPKRGPCVCRNSTS